MYTLIINGKTIEGLDVVRLTKAVNDIGNLPTRQGGYSNTLDIPATKNNLEALGMIENINSLDKTITGPAVVFDESFLIFEGVFKVLSLKENIQLVLISENSAWYELIKTKSLRDIDTTSLNHLYNESEIESRRLNTSVFVYPNIIKNLNGIPASFAWWDFLACFYINYTIDRIFTDIGYTVTMPSIDEITKGVIISNEGGFTILGSAQPTLAEYNNDATAPTLSITGFFNYLGFSPVTDLVQQLYLNLGTQQGLSNSVNASYIKNNIDKEILITINTTFDAVAASIGETVSMAICKRDGTRILTVNRTMFNGSNSINFQFETTLALDEEYIFELAIPGSGSITNLTYNYQLYGNSSASFFDNQQKYSIYNSPIRGLVYNLSNAFPDMLQSDFLIDLFNRLCLITTTNFIAKTVAITRFQDILLNIPRAIDWTNKIDLIEEPEVMYNFFDNYANVNNLKNAFSEDYGSVVGLGQGQRDDSFVVNYLEGINDLFQSEFMPIERKNDFALYPINNFELPNAYGIVEITSNNIIPQPSESMPTQSAEVFGSAFNFQEHLSRHYPLYIQAVQQGIALKLLLRLTRTDFDTIDFTVPIYLNVNTQSHGQIVGHFYVNEIDQWQSGESCYVTLIKID